MSLFPNHAVEMLHVTSVSGVRVKGVVAIEDRGTVSQIHSSAEHFEAIIEIERHFAMFDYRLIPDATESNTVNLISGVLIAVADADVGSTIPHPHVFHNARAVFVVVSTIPTFIPIAVPFNSLDHRRRSPRNFRQAQEYDSSPVPSRRKKKRRLDRCEGNRSIDGSLSHDLGALLDNQRRSSSLRVLGVCFDGRSRRYGENRRALNKHLACHVVGAYGESPARDNEATKETLRIASILIGREHSACRQH
mmetsp:Transcript_8683/g.16843  ORF Transcript_8683/g.16843 Transcript_8683/m.16843 type:complete len:249 (-) Transcript_8683:5281-6027(-)